MGRYFVVLFVFMSLVGCGDLPELDSTPTAEVAKTPAQIEAEESLKAEGELAVVAQQIGVDPIELEGMVLSDKIAYLESDLVAEVDFTGSLLERIQILEGLYEVVPEVSPALISRIATLEAKMLPPPTPDQRAPQLSLIARLDVLIAKFLAETQHQQMLRRVRRLKSLAAGTLR